MADSNLLRILNHFPIPLTIYVRQDGWNCCDEPVPGQAVGYVQPNASVDLTFVRKDGHGCDGRQGEFLLALNVTMSIAMNFDAKGGMASPSPTGCNAQLAQVEGGNYHMIVYPA